MKYNELMTSEELFKITELLEGNFISTNREGNISINDVKETLTNQALQEFKSMEFNNANEMLVHLFSDDNLLKKHVVNIAKRHTRLLKDFMDYEDTYQQVMFYIMNGFSLANTPKKPRYFTNIDDRQEFHKFNDLMFILKDVKNISKNIVFKELNKKSKFYHNPEYLGKDEKGNSSYDFVQYVEKVGFKSTMTDKIETMNDMLNLLDDKEFQAFTLYVQGYKVRDIDSMVKNGRRKYDSMKAKVESYYLQFNEDYSQIYIESM